MKKFAILASIACVSIGLAACNQAPTAPAPAAPRPAAPANTAAPAAPAAPASAPAGDATNQNFTLSNRAPNAITHLYVSPVSSENWGPDILGRGILPAGETASVTFPRAATECNWDLRVTNEDGSNQELRNINLCETTDVVYGPQ